MSKRLRVVFDMDCVLNDLCSKSCEMHGIDYRKFDRYKISECSFTEEEKTKILQDFYDAKVFEQVGFVRDAIKLNELQAICDVFVHTLCCNEQVADWKRDNLPKLLTDIPIENIVIEVGNSKQLIPADIVIEDCAENLLNSSDYKLGILLDKPYNRHKELLDKIRERNIVRKYSLGEAIEYIIDIVKEGG